MKKIITFCLLLLSFIVYCQNESDEKLINWIYPKNISKKIFELNSLEFKNIHHYEMVFSDLKDDSFVVDNNKYQIDGNKVILISKEIDGNQYKFLENNTYWELPESDKPKFWKFSEMSGYFYDCTSYWKTIDGVKNLIVERVTFDKNNRSNNLKKIEFYQKDFGLIKIDLFDLNVNKLVEVHTAESFDKPQKEEKSFAVEEPKTVYPDGVIPKSYKVKLLIDKNLPYLVKDTIVLYNKKGIMGITPKLMKNGVLLFDGKSVINEEYSVKEMTIIETKYYKSPFSFKYKVYYSDGESNFRNVEIKDFYLTFEDYVADRIRYKISDWYENDKIKIKEEIDKKTEIYETLLKKVKNQCFVFVIEYIDENNLEYNDYVSLKID